MEDNNCQKPFSSDKFNEDGTPEDIKISEYCKKEQGDGCEENAGIKNYYEQEIKHASDKSDKWHCETDSLIPNGKTQHRVQFDNSADVELEAELEDGFESSSSSSSSSSSDDVDSVHYLESKPPDGGWGWVVVFASFMVNVIADGITFSFGVIFTEFLVYFDESRSKTAWIVSLFMAIPLLSGPFASYLTDRYGCRKVSICGGLLAAFGFFVSAFVDSLELLFFTFGIVSGLGLSVCFVASVVIVAYYFEKRRSFATGLSVCGSGIGTLIFPPLIQYLIEEYGWRGATLVLAGVLLNLCVFGSLMRDLEWTKKKFKERRKHKKRFRSHTTSSIDSGSQYSQHQSSSAIPSLEEFKRILHQSGLEGVKRNTIDDSSNSNLAKDDEPRLCSSLVNLPTFVRNGEKVPLEVLESLSTNRHLYSVLVHNYPSLLISSRSISDSGRINEQIRQHKNCKANQNPKFSAQFLARNKPVSPLSQTNSTNITENTEESSSTYTRNTYDKPKSADTFVNNKKAEKGHSILKKKSESLKRGLATVQNSNNVWWCKKETYTEGPRVPTAFLQDLRVHRHSLTYRGAMLNISRYKLRASSCPDIYRNSMTTIAREKTEWYAGLIELGYVLQEMVNFSYFRDISFLLFTVSNFLLYICYDVPYVFIGDFASEIGYSKTESAYLISVMGILSMVGEIALGWAGDQCWINVRIVYAGCMMLCGTFVTLVPKLTTYETFCLVSGGFGLFVSANYSLTSIILVQMITIEKFSSAYGLLLLVQGVANLVGPPIAGWLCDVTNSYDYSFYAAGLSIVLSGILLTIIPCFKRVKKYQQKRFDYIAGDQKSELGYGSKEANNTKQPFVIT